MKFIGLHLILIQLLVVFSRVYGDMPEDLLGAAIRANDVQGISTAVLSGADVNSGTPEHDLPLIIALISGSFEAFEHLLRGGADPNVNGPEGRPLAYYLIGSENRRYLLLAIDYGLDVNVDVTGVGDIDLFSGKVRRSPLLFSAAAKGNVNVVHDLLRAGADASRRDSEDRTLLETTIENGSFRVGWFLVYYGHVDLSVESHLPWWNREFFWQKRPLARRSGYWLERFHGVIEERGYSRRWAVISDD